MFGPDRRVDPMLPQVEPVLPVEQRADLHHPHIVVGVAEPEVADLGPAAKQEPGAKPKPRQNHDPAPSPVEQVEQAGHSRLQAHVLALVACFAL